MNRIIAALHQVDYVARGLADYGRREQYLERQIARWSKQYRASETERIESMDRLIEWLPPRIPAKDECSIVHGDYRFDNVIVHPVEPRVVAVLDWELSTLGHPLADLSYHMQIWRLTHGQFRGMADKDLALLGIPDEQSYLNRYCQRTGHSPVEPREWEFYMAFNLFRLAAILQGIAKRALDGNASDPAALETGQRARTIAEIAWGQVASHLL
jgi:aminoglycoside phosphotransferase (APT) family kinase protein